MLPDGQSSPASRGLLVALSSSVFVPKWRSRDVGAWDRTLSSLEAQAKSLRADDQRRRPRRPESPRSRCAGLQWLKERGQTVVDPGRGTGSLMSSPGCPAFAHSCSRRGRCRGTPPPRAASSIWDAWTWRSPRGWSRESPSVTSIDAELFRALDAKTVTEALEAAPGITMHRMGARNEGMVYLRGFDLRQVPLFIDGIPVYVPYDGYVDLDRFVTDDLSEVRVTKGMTSALIGPNALGGAINLVTKRPTKPFSGLFNAGYGRGTSARWTRTRHHAPKLYVHATASWFGADEFPLSSDFTPNSFEDGGARNNSSHGDGKGQPQVRLDSFGTR